MFGFDSLSRNAWIRKLPKSYEYMTKHLHADVLQGYNIVGDGTPQALIPVGSIEFSIWIFFFSNLNEILTPILCQFVSFSPAIPNWNCQKRVSDFPTRALWTRIQWYFSIMHDTVMWLHSTRICPTWAHFHIDWMDFKSNQPHITCDHFIWHSAVKWAETSDCVSVIHRDIKSWWIIHKRFVKHHLKCNSPYFDQRNELYWMKSLCWYWCVLWLLQYYKSKFVLSLQFMQAYHGRKPQFAFSFHGELSHDSINLVGVADEDFKEWLESLKSNGLLDRTILVLMADHGNR